MKKLLMALFVVMILVAACGEGTKTTAKQGIVDSSSTQKTTSAFAQPKTKILGNEFVCSGQLSGVKMTTYYQGRKFRVETEVTGSANVPKTKALYDYALGEMWVWNEEMKFGQHVSKEAIQKMRTSYPDVPENPSYDMIVAEWERQGFTCQEKDLPDSLFQIPTDIQFTERT